MFDSEESGGHGKAAVNGRRPFFNQMANFWAGETISMRVVTIMRATESGGRGLLAGEPGR